MAVRVAMYPHAFRSLGACWYLVCIHLVSDVVINLSGKVEGGLYTLHNFLNLFLCVIQVEMLEEGFIHSIINSIYLCE